MIKKIDSLGRIVIPQALRTRFNIDSGDELEIGIIDNYITIQKTDAAIGEDVAKAIKLLKENGYTVVKE